MYDASQGCWEVQREHHCKETGSGADTVYYGNVPSRKQAFAKEQLFPSCLLVDKLRLTTQKRCISRFSDLQDQPQKTV